VDKDEIEDLINQLRELLDANGFGWVREQAEASVDPSWHPRWLALALIGASEAVTVDLAKAELFTTEILGGEAEFKPDDGADQDDASSEGDDVANVPRRAAIDRLRGPQRREAVQALAGLSGTFNELRALLNGQL
jgi:hypothetical protein